MKRSKIGTVFLQSKSGVAEEHRPLTIAIRLDLHHEIMRLAWQNDLFRAPITEPHRILDIGIGTGIWAIDMADKFPMANVIGTDLSPIQPSWVPPNWYVHPYT